MSVHEHAARSRRSLAAAVAVAVAAAARGALTASVCKRNARASRRGPQPRRAVHRNRG